MIKNTAAIVLAAGKGTRLNSKDKNKVMLSVGGKPMVERTVNILRKAGLSPIILVVGFAKESIKTYFGNKVLYANQDKQLGTAHAARCGLRKVPEFIENIVVVYGDDSYCYPPQLLQKLVKRHKDKNADITMLTVKKENPYGLGRILRDKKDRVIGIVEEKNATDKQKKIKEINTGCYIFKRDFLNYFIPLVKKNPVSGEYYLTDLVELAVQNNKIIEAIRGENILWRGVNTREELEEACNMFKENEQTD